MVKAELKYRDFNDETNNFYKFYKLKFEGDEEVRSKLGLLTLTKHFSHSLGFRRTLLILSQEIRRNEWEIERCNSMIESVKKHISLANAKEAIPEYIKAKKKIKDLKPEGNTTRAQVAVILQRFCENNGM